MMKDPPAPNVESAVGDESQPGDHDLLHRTSLGDRDAFAELVRRHQQRAVALAQRFLGRADAAEDVAQDAFIRVFQSASSYTPQAKFTTWLYRIVANLCWDARRRRARNDRTPPVASYIESASGDLLERRETAAAVRNAIAELPDRQRLVVILHRFDGLGHEEIAEITGWSRSAVESCLVRAYAQLRITLAPLSDSPGSESSAGRPDVNRSTSEDSP
ncbi:MAG: RNA polymerase sigma factor SigM [Planctomycetota bacterium]